PEIQTEEKESQQRSRRIEPAILTHGVINPVASAGVPENPAKVCQQECLPGSCCLESDRFLNFEVACRTRPQQSYNQRCECDPGEEIESGQRKDQHLQYRRQNNQ